MQWDDQGTDAAAVAAHLAVAAEAGLPVVPGNGSQNPLALQAGATLRAQQLLEGHLGQEDRILGQQVRALDDLFAARNGLGERLHEWALLHDPSGRGNLEGRIAAGIAEGEDQVAIRALLAAAQSLDTAIVALEARVTSAATQLAPNLSFLLGPQIAARFIGHSGSIERLSVMSAGTFQTLGAETALFRHLKEGNKPPKHGFLFQVPEIHNAPVWQRGKLARCLAGLGVIAARADVSGSDLTQKLKRRWDSGQARAATKPKPKPAAKPVPKGGKRGPRQRGKPPADRAPQRGRP